MRIVCFEHEGQAAIGVRTQEQVCVIRSGPASALNSVFADLPKFAAQASGQLINYQSLTLLPPVPAPRKIICIGLNYAGHAREAGHPIPEYPAIFLRVATSLAGPNDPLVRPRASAAFDYEAELAFVIGKPAHQIKSGSGIDHVAGYSCFNDGSLRDYQTKTQQWTMGKNFDNTGGFGPELVTPDELPTAAKGLSIKLRLNGNVLQDSNTADLIFNVPRIVEILSEVMTLEPGDVVITGTPAGVGAARKPPIFMKAGDICEVEIEGIGTLRNAVVDEAE